MGLLVLCIKYRSYELVAGILQPHKSKRLGFEERERILSCNVGPYIRVGILNAVS